MNDCCCFYLLLNDSFIILLNDCSCFYILLNYCFSILLRSYWCWRFDLLLNDSMNDCWSFDLLLNDSFIILLNDCCCLYLWLNDCFSILLHYYCWSFYLLFNDCLNECFNSILCGITLPSTIVLSEFILARKGTLAMLTVPGSKSGIVFHLPMF